MGGTAYIRLKQGGWADIQGINVIYHKAMQIVQDIIC